MLREEVLRKWKGCKEKTLASQKRTLTKEEVAFLESLTDNLSDMDLRTDEDIISALRRKLSRINQNFQAIRIKAQPLWDAEEESLTSYLNFVYVGYTGIVESYNQLAKIRD